MSGRAAIWMLAALGGPLLAQQTEKMTARLAEEADAFRRLAPLVVGQEKLHQKAQKPPSRFHPRIGNAAKAPPPVVWQERQIVSQYGFTAIKGEENSLHELRQVTEVDGRKIADDKKAQDVLAKAAAGDDAQKKRLLKEFEKYGLIGAVTDFGQLILLFGPRDIERYAFTLKGPGQVAAAPALVFAYRQISGPEELTLFEANHGDQASRMQVQGEVWVQASDLLPLRITLSAKRGDLDEEAGVDYEMSRFGALLPASTTHRELRGGKLVAENTFLYTDFLKFGASSEIKFQPLPPPQP